MPRDYKTPMRRQRRPLPGWAMLVIGVFLGLFMSAVVYLSSLSEPSTNQSVKVPSDALDQRLSRQEAEKGTQQSLPPKPQFEFYSVLPELEVVVPEPIPAEPIAPTPPPKAARKHSSPEPAKQKASYYLQTGSFKSEEEADRMKANLVLLGLDVVIQTVSVNSVRWHRVRVGPYTTLADLKTARKRLTENNVDFMVLKARG